MTESRFQFLRSKIIRFMADELDPRLTYHNLAHTQDVMAMAQRIAAGEGITDPRELMLLNLATLFHDTGFKYTYKDHEEKSCEIFEEHLEPGELTEDEVRRVKGMIMATKIPQTPHNHMERIICDADLDYLGRDDFGPISEGLKKEFLEFGVIKNEADWNPLQVRFFEHHQYFTETCRHDRAPQKSRQLARLKELL